MHLKINIIIIYLFCFFNFSCNTTDPPDNQIIKLTVEDVSCTEAWLKLETENLDLPAQINLLVNDKLKSNYTLSSNDTILYIDSLLPNKSYTVKAQVSSIQNLTSSIELTTMDTTSHNFTFETFTFGGGGETSFINDVAIINEDNIWACGEIYLPDSLGNPDSHIYNAIHWDGDRWEPKRIKVYVRNNLIVPPLFGAIAFSAEDIWFSAGVPIHGNGTNWTQYHLFDMGILSQNDGSVNHIWGRNSSDLFFVGDRGTIAYHNGQFPGNGWQKIESGTSTIINDVWGIVNENNEVTAYCPVSSFFTSGDKKILRIKNSIVDSIPWNIGRLIYSAWTNKERFLYVCGSGAFEYKYGIWKEISLPPISMNKIRGNGLNDIFIAGDFGFASHFNGLSWKTYNDLYDTNTAYYSLNIKRNIVVLVGFSGGYGIISIGKRN